MIAPKIKNLLLLIGSLYLIGCAAMDLPPAPQQTGVEQKIESSGFLFELYGCKQSYRTIKCNLRVTNKNDRGDRILIISQLTRMIDDSGKEYRQNYLLLGNNSPGFVGDVQSSLAYNVPITASVTFENIPYKVEKIALLDLDCHGPSLGLDIKGFSGKVQFRDILVPKTR